MGAEYGSSAGRPYLNLRPAVAGGATPSVTTYSFERPTPATGWTFVLGDVDADQVRVSATGADGQPVAASALGFRGTFNYCVPGVCTPTPNQPTVPTWDPATGILLGNPTSTDTNGASAWFEPSVPLSSLTFEFTRRSGFPVYQTWFSALSFEVTGTVEVPDGTEAGGLTLRLFDPEGNQVGTTQTNADGSYSFENLATYDGYRLQLDRPPGLTSDTPLTRTVDLSEEDQTENFTLRAIVPVPVSGRVTVAGEPLSGVTITLRDDGGTVVGTATTDSTGEYFFDQVEPGNDYTLTVTVPDGFILDSPGVITFDVPEDSEEPITEQNFLLTAAPAPPTGSASGTVRDQEAGTDPPVAGVLITVAGPDDAEYEVRTDADGNWSLDDLPPGDYTATVTAPDGSEVVGAASIPFTIPADGGDRTDLDFLVDQPEPAADVHRVRSGERRDRRPGARRRGAGARSGGRGVRYRHHRRGRQLVDRRASACRGMDCTGGGAGRVPAGAHAHLRRGRRQCRRPLLRPATGRRHTESYAHADPHSHAYADPHSHGRADLGADDLSADRRRLGQRHRNRLVR